MNDEEITQLLRFADNYKDFFYCAIGDWDTYTINLELNPYSKPFNCKFYPVPMINKETFRKELKRFL